MFRFKSLFSLLFVIALLIFLVLSTLTGCKDLTDSSLLDVDQTDNAIIIEEQSSYEVIDLFVIIDQSGSMSTVSNPTDPYNKRITATQRFIYSLMLKSDPNLPHQIGLISFGTTVPDEYFIPLSPLSSDSEANAISSSLVPLDLGWTNFIEALKMADKGFIEAGTYESDRKPVVIIFTDGEPDDIRRLSLEQYFAEINDYLNDTLANVEVFLIAIDITGEYWGRSEPFWSEILPDTNIFQLDNMDELAQKYNLIISSLLGIENLPPEIVTAKGLEFTVRPYLEAMEILSFQDEASIDLQLVKPDGNILDLGNEDIYVREMLGGKIIWINRPEPGTWSFKIAQGRGEVTVYRNEIPADVKLLRPSLEHPTKMQSELIAFFAYKDGSRIESHLEYPLNLFVEMISPNGMEQTLPLVEQENGLFRSHDYLQFPDPGDYKIRVVVRGGEKYVYQRKFNLQTVEYPYLVVEEPANHSIVDLDNNLKIKVRLYKNGEPIDPVDIIKGPPESMVLVQMVTLMQSGEDGNLIWLRSWSDEGYWEGIVPFSGLEGTYHLTARLVGELRGSDEPIVVDSLVTFQAQPSLFTMLRTVFGYAMLIAAVIILILILYFLFWYGRLSLLRGNLTITFESGQSINIRLQKKKLILKRVHKNNVDKNGWIIVYSNSKKTDYVLIRWSKTRFMQPIRLRPNESRTLGKMGVRFY